MCEVSTEVSDKVSSVMTPVRPMPPAVAQKSSGSSSGHVSGEPVGVDELEPFDMGPQGAVAVVVLPVHVARDRPAQADKTSCRG